MNTSGHRNVNIVHVYKCSTCVHIGHVAASVGTFNRAGVYTLACACASALQLRRNKCVCTICLSTNMLTQQAFAPLIDHDI